MFLINSSYKSPPCSIEESQNKRQSDSINVLKALYTKPPLVKLKYSKYHPKSKIELDPEVLGSTLSTQKDKTNTAKFYIEQTKPIQEAIKNVPVYMVVNSFDEMIIAKNENYILSDLSGLKKAIKNNQGYQPSNKSDLSRTYKGNQTLPYHFIKTVESFEVNDLELESVVSNKKYDVNSIPNSAIKKAKKILNTGIFFLDKVDAECYMKTLAGQKEGSQVGLKLYCIGLDTAYSIIYSSPAEMDFRFVPSIRNVEDCKHDVIGVPLYVITIDKQLKGTRDKTNYVFFEESMAIKFAKQKREAIRTLNLEDLLDFWENKLVSKTDKLDTLLNVNNTHFVPSNSSQQIVSESSLKTETRGFQNYIGLCRAKFNRLSYYFSVWYSNTDVF